MNTIHDLTSAQLRQAAAIKDQIEALENQLEALLGASAPAARVTKPASKSFVAKGTRGKPVEGVTGMVLKKISDQEIKDFIGAERTQSALVKEYGQFAPKRLKDMKKAGLLAMHRVGLRKFWRVV